MKILNSKGNASIILCVAIIALLCITAYVIDIGIVYVEKTKLSNAVDAAALAACFELPEDRTKAIEIAEEYLVKNDVNPDDVLITIDEDNKSIEIQGIKNVKHFFAPIFGVNDSNVNAISKAVIGAAKSVNGGIRPFAVEVFDYEFGDRLTLKEDAGDGYRGNYGAIALGGNGAQIFRDNALDGYGGTISVGDLVDTEPGNMGGAANAIKRYINSEMSTFDNFDRDSKRLWTLPLVDSLNVAGREQVLVVGFGEFFVEKITKKSGKIEITGRFIRYVTSGEIDMELDDTGTYGRKLVK